MNDVNNDALIGKMLAYLRRNGLNEAEVAGVRGDLLQMAESADAAHVPLETHLGKQYRDFCDDLLEFGFGRPRPARTGDTDRERGLRFAKMFAGFMIALPPLILGLTEIYWDFFLPRFGIGRLLLCDGIPLLLLIVLYAAVARIRPVGRLDAMTMRWLAFGLLSHVVVFLFVFQNRIGIEYVIDVYMATIALIALHFALIDRRRLNVEELTIAIVLFLAFRFHEAFVSRYASANFESVIVGVPWWLRIVYGIIVPGTVCAFYLVRIVRLHLFDPFAIVFAGLSLISVLLLIPGIGQFQQVRYTSYLLMAFTVVVDLIYARIARKTDTRKIAYYLRIAVLVFFFYLYSARDYFTRNSYALFTMYEYTYIMIATVGINVIEHFVRSSSRRGDDAHV